MKLITKPEELEVGRLYWCRWKDQGVSKPFIEKFNDRRLWLSVFSRVDCIGPIPEQEPPNFNDYMEKE